MTSRTLLSAATLGLACLCGSAAASPDGAPHAAACVAALKAQEASLAESVKAGQSREPVLLTVVRSGIAIIGTQYLAGLREGEARELLKAAEQDFQALPPDEARARQSACLQEGEVLYSKASPLEQSLITNAAQRRVRRLTASS
ncbi:MAG TPA: hypothetical protein VLD35_14950 [Caldimonas sp.]|nr:hypothetical protein [Caldimonas sp.]